MAYDYGIKISRPNVDVKTAGLKDLFLHSKYPFLKIKAIGYGSTSFTDGGAGFNVLLHTHSLGYNPIAYVYSQRYDSFLNTMITDYERMPVYERSAGGLIQQKYAVTVSTTELRFSGGTFGGSGGSKTINYFWVVYFDPE